MDGRRLPSGSQRYYNNAVLAPYMGGAQPDQAMPDDPVYQAYKARLPPDRQMRQSFGSRMNVPMQQMLVDHSTAVSQDQQQRFSAMQQGGPTAVAALGPPRWSQGPSQEQQQVLRQDGPPTLGNQFVARLNTTYGLPLWAGGAAGNPGQGSSQGNNNGQQVPGQGTSAGSSSNVGGRPIDQERSSGSDAS